MPEKNEAYIRLSEPEFRWAVNTGCERNISSKLRGRKDSAGLAGKLGFDEHIMGACGELATCRFMKVPWRGSIDDFHELPDITPHHEVRTRSSASYDLIVRPKDPVQRIYWLVSAIDTPDGIARNYVVRGWLPIENYGRLATFEMAPAGRPAALFIPAASLRNPNDDGWRTYKFSGEAHV